MSVAYKRIGELTMKKIVVCMAVLLFGCVSSLGSHFQAGESRDAFWERFRTAVIKKDRATVASLAQFPISMPYGYRTVRNGAQLTKRYREVEGQGRDINHVLLVRWRPSTYLSGPM